MPVQNTFSALSKRAFGAFVPSDVAGAWSIIPGSFETQESASICVTKDGSRCFVTDAVGKKIVKFTNFGQNFTESTFLDRVEDVSCNYNGQYVLVGTDQPSSNVGFFKSSNFGSTWTRVVLDAQTTQTWNAVAVSESGEIQLVLSADSGYGRRLFRSINYGNSWQLIKTWTTSDQFYPTINGRGGIISLNKNATTAFLTGNVPILITDLLGASPTVTAINNIPNVDWENKIVGMAKELPILVAGTPYKVWISFDLGTNWNIIFNQYVPSIDKIAVSGDASVIMLGPNRAINPPGNIPGWFISYDYGATWEFVQGDYNAPPFSWYVVGVSDDGRVRYAVSSLAIPPGQFYKGSSYVNIA